MRRKTFDTLFTAGGAVLTIVLVVAGALLMWGATFANNNVHDQLAREQIFVPALGSKALASPEIGPYLNKYAGQQVVNGEQAGAYANHFIAVHLQEIGGGQTYAQLSAKSQANPTDTKLAAQVQTVFRGETLRGLLLNAYAFGELGHIAQIASIAAFSLAGVMLLLSVLGVIHLRRTSPDQQILTFERQSARAA